MFANVRGFQIAEKPGAQELLRGRCYGSVVVDAVMVVVVGRGRSRRRSRGGGGGAGGGGGGGGCRGVVVAVVVAVVLVVLPSSWLVVSISGSKW